MSYGAAMTMIVLQYVLYGCASLYVLEWGIHPQQCVLNGQSFLNNYNCRKVGITRGDAHVRTERRWCTAPQQFRVEHELASTPLSR